MELLQVVAIWYLLKYRLLSYGLMNTHLKDAKI